MPEYPVAYRRGSPGFQTWNPIHANTNARPAPRIPVSVPPLRSRDYRRGLRPAANANYAPAAPAVRRRRNFVPVGAVAAAMAAAAFSMRNGEAVPQNAIVGEGEVIHPAGWRHLRDFSPKSLAGWPPPLEYRRYHASGYTEAYLSALPDNWTVGLNPAQFQDIEDIIASANSVFRGHNWTGRPTAWNGERCWVRDASSPEVSTPAGLVPMEVPQYFPFPAYQPPIFFGEPMFVPESGIGSFRRIRDEASPDLVAEPYPRNEPRPRLRPNQEPVVGVVVNVPPVGVPTASAAPVHPQRPPRAGRERERKARRRAAGAFASGNRIGQAFRRLDEATGLPVRRVFDAVTEAMDWLNAVFYSIDGAPPGLTPQEKAQFIWENYERIDVDQLIENIVIMELQDRALGEMSRRAYKGLSGAGFSGDFFGPLL